MPSPQVIAIAIKVKKYITAPIMSGHHWDRPEGYKGAELSWLAFSDDTVPLPYVFLHVDRNIHIQN
jgi:hypothetical protein